MSGVQVDAGGRVRERDIEYLKTVIPGSRIKTKAEISEDFSHDELGEVRRPPDVLIDAMSTEEISKVMAYAYRHDIPVTARGQGTGLVGGAVPIAGGILITLTSMKRILELDEENLVLTVEPGVLLMEIAAFTAKRGYLYPPDPGEKSATIGGNISTNAGGMRAVKYGVTRDYVEGLEVVLPDGTVLETGGKVVKNSSGYSIKDMIVGSEGTLGVVTKAHLRLLPMPPVVVSLLLPFPSLELAVATAARLVGSRHLPTAIEFMERGVIEAAEDYLAKPFPDNSAEAYLLLSFDGSSKEDVEKAYSEAAELCLNSGAIDAFIADTVERQAAIWTARGAFLEAIKASTTEMDECDVVVPRNRIAEFIGYSREVQHKTNLRISSFGHAGDGNLHLYLLRDDLEHAEWERRRDAAFELLYSRAKEFGGQVSGEHGIGFAKKPYLAQILGDDGLALMRRIKHAFDPKGLLNPGKVV